MVGLTWKVDSPQMAPKSLVSLSLVAQLKRIYMKKRLWYSLCVFSDFKDIQGDDIIALSCTVQF